jgi:Tol biopolymer transport system component
MFDRQSGKATPFLASPFAESSLQFSPDGKWVAYVQRRLDLLANDN